jgi:hypothetical protein
VREIAFAAVRPAGPATPAMPLWIPGRRRVLIRVMRRTAKTKGVADDAPGPLDKSGPQVVLVREAACTSTSRLAQRVALRMS